MTVMRLVRVNNDDPPGRTRLRFAAIMEALQPGFSDADRVSRVPMPVIRVTRKTGAETLQPGNGRFDDQEIGKDGHRLCARTFKTASAAALGSGTMMYPTKTALVIRADLLSWQIANVAAFLSGGLAGTYPEIVGEPYCDGDGRLYTPMIREPVFVYGATSAELARTHGRALNRGIRFAIYTEPLFKTTNDADNRANVAANRNRRDRPCRPRIAR